MSDAAQRAMRKKNAGDMAVDGLLAGILAGLAMAAYLILAGLLSDSSPAIILGRFDPGHDGRWLFGSLAHIAVSGVYGAGFALLFAGMLRWRPLLLRFGWLAGLLFGLVLFMIARGVLLPITGSPLLQNSTAHLLIAHAIYGLILGFEVSRKWK